MTEINVIVLFLNVLEFNGNDFKINISNNSIAEFYRKNNEQPKPPIHEWKLVYSPNNTCFDALVGNVSALLALDGIIGVPTPKDVEANMVAQQLVAGIDFHHPPVSWRFFSLQVILTILPS